MSHKVSVPTCVDLGPTFRDRLKYDLRPVLPPVPADRDGLQDGEGLRDGLLPVTVCKKVAECVPVCKTVCTYECRPVTKTVCSYECVRSRRRSAPHECRPVTRRCAPRVRPVTKTVTATSA